MSFLKVTLGTGLLATAALFPTASPTYVLTSTHPLPRTYALPRTYEAYAAAPSSPAYVNGDASGLTVTPKAPPPGSDVRLRLADCTERTAIAVSSVFAADVRLTVSDGTLTGEGRIRSTVEAGTYDVRVACGDTGGIGTITVGNKPKRQPPQRPDPVRPPKQAKPQEPAEPAKPAEPVRPDPPASPIAPVEAGGGGTARLAAAKSREDGKGPGTGHVVTGLVLASVAAGAIALGGVRRRSRRQG